MNVINVVFKDRNGKIVIGQWPNVYLYGWALASVLAWRLEGAASGTFSTVALWCLVLWALLEVLTGVNLFRRLVGIAMLLLLAFT